MAVKLCYEDYSVISVGKLVSSDNKALYYFDKIDTLKDCKIVTSFVDSSGSKKDYSINIKKAPVPLDMTSGSNYSRPDSVILTFSDSGKIISYYVNSDNEFIKFSDQIPDAANSFFSPKNTYACMRIDYSTPYDIYPASENQFMYFSDLIFGKEVDDPKEWEDKESVFSCSVKMGKNEDGVYGCFIDVTILDLELLSSDIMAVNVTFDLNPNFVSTYPILKTKENKLFVPLYDMWQYSVGGKTLYIGLQAIKNGTKLRSFYTIDDHGVFHIIDKQWYDFDFDNLIKTSNKTNDVIPPELTIGTNYYSDSAEFSHFYFHVKDPYWDDNSSLVNERGKIPVKLYYGKRSERELSLNEIRILSCLNLELDAPENRSNPVYVPLTGFLDDVKNEPSQHYDLYLFVEDKSGNYTYQKTEYDFYRNNEYEVIYDETSKELQDIKFKAATESYMTSYRNSFEIALTSDFIDSYVPNIFLKANIDYEENNMTYEYSYYVYSTKTQCNAKNIIQSGKMLTVLHDQPVYIHTVASPVNFGDDIHSWETWTVDKYKLNKKVITVTTEGSVQFDNYEYPALTEIPEGWYYAAIIYFADNSSTIGTVFQN